MNFNCAKTLKDTDGGNIDTPSYKCRKHIFTLNNYNEKDLEQLAEISGGCINFVYQEEIAPTTGTPHIQGYLEFKHARWSNPMKQKIPNIWLRGAKGSFEDNLKYCTKSETKKPGGRIWTNAELLKDPMDGLVMKWWQLEIREILKGPPDNRAIYWYWSDKGNVGKSVFGKHICMHYKAIMVSGRAKDIKYGVCEMDPKPKIIIVDIPRSKINNMSYIGLEEVKNGCFFSPKYESGMVIMNVPHVICFANFPPQLERMSMDRWIIKNIDELPKEPEYLSKDIELI